MTQERYEYRSIRIERGAWTKVAEAAYAIGGVFGVWRGEIGWYTDEGALMAVDGTDLGPLPGVIDATVAHLQATVRPTEPVGPTENGIYAHRWFEVYEADVEEFVRLSQDAWPDFEATYDGTRIVGLWRDLDAAPPARLLLITRYPTLATWESSRPYSPGVGAEHARAKFLRRSELTKRTVVRISRLTRPS